MALTETSAAPMLPDEQPAVRPAPPQLTDIAGLVKGSVWAGDRTLPVASSVKGLFPDGGLRRGSTVVVSGSTSLALSTMAAASAEGSWCAAVGFQSLGLVAAAELGIELGRFALVPHPGAQWLTVVAALLDALDIVLVHPRMDIRPADARRLASRARERGSVLIAVTDHHMTWPQADIRLVCQGTQWQGLGTGHGHLRKQQLKVVAQGRGAAARERQALVSLLASCA